MVVGFGPAQLRGQGAEGVGVDDGLGLIAGEPGAADQGGPAVVLSCGGDGSVFGGELGDRVPPVLLGGDGLVCRQHSSAELSAHDLATAGPVALNETWSRIRTDSTHHAVLRISE